MKKPDYSWQDRCVDQILTSVSQGNRDYLVNATPGAGKTHMTVKLAQHMIVAGLIDFVVVVVPTGTVRDQFVEDMAKEGITLAKIVDGVAFRNMKAYGVGEHVHGFCLTTGMLMGCAVELALMTERYKVLHVSDEAHHNGKGLDWGKSAIAASNNAVLRLGLSGTPYRSDRQEIPFLHYEEGVGVPHFEFTHKQARDAHLVTAIDFRTVSGYEVIHIRTIVDETHRFDFDETLDDAGESQRMRWCLDYRSHYLYKLVREADIELQRVRTAQPHHNAAGIVFANTRLQAKYISKYLRGLGRTVRVVIDDADSSEEVKKFNESGEEWIVQIRKVYEGANIPRLRVGVYATNWTSEAFFNQAGPRGVRVLPGVDPDDMPFLMFMPVDSRLHQMAEEWGKVSRHVIKENDRDEDADPGVTDEGNDSEAGDDSTGGRPFIVEFLEGDVRLSSMIIDNVTYSVEDIEAAEAYCNDIPEVRGQSSITKMRIHAFMKRTGKL